MKKIIAILILLLLLFPVAAFAQEESQPSENQLETQPEINKKAEPNWENLKEMQIALMLISKQYDYLINRLEEADNKIKETAKNYEDRLQREINRTKEIEQKYQDRITQMEAELAEARENISRLERNAAIFNSKNGVYLKMVLSFLVGLAIGFIVASVMRLWRNITSQRQLST